MTLISLSPTKTAPRWFLVSVIAITLGLGLLGGVLTFLGGRGGTALIPSEELSRLRGPLLHTSLQSIGATIALLTAVCAFAHSSLVRDQTTALVGAAFLFAGLIDAFHLAVLDHFVARVDDVEQFGPFTWALSRIFHAGIVALGTGPFAWGAAVSASTPRRNVLPLLAAGAVMGVGTFSMIQVCAHIEDLPDALQPQAFVPRPWDAIALGIYLFAGGVLLPRFYRRHPSLFSYGLLLSLAPQVLGELVVAFGSRATYDPAFFTGQLLKLFGYMIPLVGLLIDYVRVYQAEGELRATREKLRVAREIQQGLLPQAPPLSDHYAMAGMCIPTDAVGGDFYDFVPMADGCEGVVIADVSGHDLGAGILMSQARAYLRAEAAYTRDPAELLDRVNRFLCHDVQDRRFISMAVVVLQGESEEIRYAAAGHAVQIVSEGGLVRELPPTGPVLGVIETSYELGDPMTLDVGESLLVMTDGWSEATGVSGEAFGNRRIFDILAAHATGTPNEMLDALYEAVLKFRDRRSPDDDLTAVIVQRTPQPVESAATAHPAAQDAVADDHRSTRRRSRQPNPG